MRKLIIIDDDSSMRLSLSHLLHSLPNVEIQCFESGDLFLAEAEHCLPACLILDLNMPGSSGLAVLETLQSGTKPFAAIVLTGAADIHTAVQAMKLGATDFLEKPCHHKRLLEAVELALVKQGDQWDLDQRKGQALTKIESLSCRERDVLMGLMDGQTNKMIAHNLGISHRTVEIYRAKLLDKLAVRTLADAFRIAFTAGLYQDF